MFKVEERFKEKARVQFTSLLQDKIRWISQKCYPYNLGHQLKELSEIIEAGKKMEVTTASPFTDKDIAELTEQLVPYRTLEMNAELELLLIQAVQKQGVHHEFFAK